MVEYNINTNKYSLILTNILSVKNDSYINFKILNKTKLLFITTINNIIDNHLNNTNFNKLHNKKNIINFINDIIEFFDLVTTYQDKLKIFSRLTSLILINLIYYKQKLPDKLINNINKIILPALNDNRKLIWLLINNTKSIYIIKKNITNTSETIYKINESIESKLMWLHDNL